MALGYISAFAETLALAVIVSKGVPPLKDALISEPEDHIKAAAAWSLGQLGSHSPDHARALAEADVLRHLLAVMMHEDSSEGALRRTSGRAAPRHPSDPRGLIVRAARQTSRPSPSARSRPSSSRRRTSRPWSRC